MFLCKLHETKSIDVKKKLKPAVASLHDAKKKTETKMK